MMMTLKVAVQVVAEDYILQIQVVLLQTVGQGNV